MIDNIFNIYQFIFSVKNIFLANKVYMVKFGKNQVTLIFY